MRYIRNQIVTKTIYNGIIDDEESIVRLIENLIKTNIDIHFEYRDPINDFIKVCEKVRILDIKNNIVKIRSFVGRSMTVISGISINNIESIKVTTGRSIISLDEDSISVGEFIDFT